MRTTILTIVSWWCWLSALAAPLHPLPTLSSKGMIGLKMVETGNREWVNNPDGGSPYAWFEAWDGANHPTGATLNGETVSQTYTWGTCDVSFTVLPDQTLKISGTITNTGTTDLKLNLTLGKIDFPTDTKSDIKVNCEAQPGFIYHDGSKADVTACKFAYHPAAWTGTEMVLGQENWGNNALYAKGLKVPAGTSAGFDFHLNFVTTQEEIDAFRAAANHAFSVQYPHNHFTSDLRSIGQIFLVTGTGASGWAADHEKWKKNPRGWLGDPSLDISDKATFKSRMEAFCRQCVANADSVPNVRGFVIWDIEGEQYPHGASVYAGHPSKTPLMAPEMAEIMYDLISILEDNGKYQVGFCLRQHKFFENPGNPEMAFYLDAWPTGSDSAEAIADLEFEISWCQHEFGDAARIFYVDSNEGDEFNCYNQLAINHPDCLIFPECFQVTTRMYSYEPIYQQARPQDYVRNGPQTQKKYTDVYPNAQSVINLADYANTPEHVTEVKNAMLRGDPQMIRIWWGGPEFPLLKAATTEAMAAGWPDHLKPKPTPTPSPSATPSPSPSATPLPATYRLWLDQLAGWIKDNPATPDSNQGNQASQYQDWLNQEAGWIKAHPVTPDRQPKH